MQVNYLRVANQNAGQLVLAELKILIDIWASMLRRLI